MDVKWRAPYNTNHVIHIMDLLLEQLFQFLNQMV